MSTKLIGAAVALFIHSAATADVTGAYARVSNNGSADSYIIVTQRGNTLLVTFNILKMTQPGLFGGTQRTNIFAYGLGQLNPATMSAQITLSSFTEGACYSTIDLVFAGSNLTKTRVGGTCQPPTSPPEAFVLVY